MSGVWGDGMRAVGRGWRRIEAWSRHTQARSPVLFGVASGVCIAIFLFVVNPSSSLIFPVTYGLFWTAIQVYQWRPGGRGPRDYERWCARREQRDLPPSVGAWYADPTGRHRVRYWDGAQWSASVADGWDVIDDPLRADDPVALARWMDTKPERTVPRLALPMLRGMVGGGFFGAILIVTAFAFPHSVGTGLIGVGTDDQLGGVWILMGAAVAAGGVAALVSGLAYPAACAPMDENVRRRTSHIPGHTFGLTFAETLGLAAIVAAPTWIQAWPGALALVVLAGCVGVALLGLLFGGAGQPPAAGSARAALRHGSHRRAEGLVSRDRRVSRVERGRRLLRGGDATVDGDDRARHVHAGPAREVDRGAGHVVGTADAPER